MKKFPVILILSFGLGLLLISFIAHARQTSMASYYPSPSGNYTKVHLINSASGPNAATFCQPGTNAGTIFADSTTGYLEICKSDGSVASYPGSCFNRFANGGTTPACPTNYKVTNLASQTFQMTAGNSVVSWSCCFTGQGSSATASVTKSGCFSIYSTSSTLTPATCSSVDSNAYDVGCDTLASSDITTTFKRNCCFNYTSGQLSTVSSCSCPAGYTFSGSACVANTCGSLPAGETACPGPPPSTTGIPYTTVSPCAGAACTATCSPGYTYSAGACTANTCAGTLPASEIICPDIPLPSTTGTPYTIVGSCANTACTATCNSGYTYSTGACTANACVGSLPTGETACPGTPPPTNSGTAYTVVGSCGSTACTATCNPGYTLSAGACVANCTGNCATWNACPATTACGSTGTQTCEIDTAGPGCIGTLATQSCTGTFCASGTTCSSGVCKPACNDTCAAGAWSPSSCPAASTVDCGFSIGTLVCTKDSADTGSGCTGTSAANTLTQNCPGTGTLCSTGTCSGGSCLSATCAFPYTLSAGVCTCEFPLDTNGACCPTGEQDCSGVCNGGNLTCGGSCFVAGTKVSLASGKKTAVERLKVGDILLGSGGTHNKIIKFDVLPKKDRAIYSFNNGRYFVTANHIFKTTTGWKALDPVIARQEVPQIKIEQLKIGDELITLKGTTRIKEIKSRIFKHSFVYNPELNGNHEYYADGFLVHNKPATCQGNTPCGPTLGSCTGFSPGACDCNGTLCTIQRAPPACPSTCVEGCDICGVCGGPGIGVGRCDCWGDRYDVCGVCAGDGSSCAPPPTCAPDCPPAFCGSGGVCTCSPGECPTGHVCGADVCGTANGCGTCVTGQICNNTTGQCQACFVSGTRILLASGKEVSIESLKVGDVLLGSGNTHNKIVKFDTRPRRDWTIYSFNGGRYFVTGNHIFKTTTGWKAIDPQTARQEVPKIKIGQLKIGDVLITLNGSMRIDKIESKVIKNSVVYNPELDDSSNHEYYADGFLVHNK